MTPISGTVSTQLTNTPSLSPAAAATPQTTTPQSTADTVILSQSAQVSQMFVLGQSPTEIAESLGIPLSTVNSYLDIAVAALSTTSPAIASAAPAITAPKST